MHWRVVRPFRRTGGECGSDAFTCVSTQTAPAPDAVTQSNRAVASL